MELRSGQDHKQLKSSPSSVIYNSPARIPDQRRSNQHQTAAHHGSTDITFNNTTHESLDHHDHQLPHGHHNYDQNSTTLLLNPHEQHNSNRPARTDPIFNTNPDLTAAQTRTTTGVHDPTIINAVQYRECLKNHAANMGGYALDGCREFMPSGSDMNSPESFKCAACECHRNFHRKEVEGSNEPPSPQFRPNSLHYHHQLSRSNIIPTGPVGNIMMTFGGRSNGAGVTMGDQSSSEDLHDYHRDDMMYDQKPSSSSGKKRFRTKFSEEQKNKMMEFAEKLGWRIQKQDEREVQQFCTEVGVKRQVFKVWMHNKQAMKKKLFKDIDDHDQ